jgi:hypothetical protein
MPSTGASACLSCTNSAASNKYYLPRNQPSTDNNCPWDCNAGYYKGGTGKTACVGCAAGTYHASADNRQTEDAAENLCKACSLCTGGALVTSTYRISECTASQDTVCAPCSTRCAAGKYMARACTPLLDVGCDSCVTQCALDQRLSATTACSGLRSFDEVLAACVDCLTPINCTAGTQFLTGRCLGTGTTPSVCQPCTTRSCSVDSYSGGCGGYSDNACIPYRACGVNQYLQDETSTRDGTCQPCTVCQVGLSQLTPCSRYSDTVCGGRSCRIASPCERRTSTNKSSYFCNIQSQSCGVCPPGYDSDGLVCKECPRGSTCNQVGEVQCRGQCEAGVLSKCESQWDIGYAVCDEACALPPTDGTRVVSRGSHTRSTGCATYFQCRAGLFKRFNTGGTMECVECARPENFAMDGVTYNAIARTAGLTDGDLQTCLWDFVDWIKLLATNKAGEWAGPDGVGGACGLGLTSESLLAHNFTDCLKCKALVPDVMQWASRTTECEWDCVQPTDAKRGAVCVTPRRDCAVEGWVRNGLDCTPTGFPWNRQGFFKLSQGWTNKTEFQIATSNLPPPVYQLQLSRGLYSIRYSFTLNGRSFAIQGPICSAVQAWVEHREYLFAAICNKSFLVYVDLSPVLFYPGARLLIGSEMRGWRDGFRTQALFGDELYVASGGNGTLFVLDTWNCLLREVDAQPGSYLTRVYTVWGNQEKLSLLTPQPKCYGTGALAWPRRFWPLRDGWLAFGDEDGLWQFHTVTRELVLMASEADQAFETDSLMGLDAGDLTLQGLDPFS